MEDANARGRKTISHSLRTEVDFVLAAELLRSHENDFKVFPSKVSDCNQKFSKWLEDRVLALLQACGELADLKPVLLGSWARRELCPQSDLDVLFLGPEDQVASFVEKAFQLGLPLHSRTPKDPEDWSEGVEPFDILSLSQARPMFVDPELSQRLANQSTHIVKHKSSILKAIVLEKKIRHARHDDIANFLEPNLKFGPGGLRDIGVALSLQKLFSERFRDFDDYPFQVLRNIESEFLYLRRWLHVLGRRDVLSAADQFDVAKNLNWSAPDLTKYIQSQLERASFYSDWVVAQAGHRRKTVFPKDLNEALSRLKQKPGVLNELPLRLKVDRWLAEYSDVERGQLLAALLDEDFTSAMADKWLVSLARARVFEVLIPDLKRLRGHVQHDHYHRFTADAHLLQALREVGRFMRKRSRLGALQPLLKQIKSKDISILKWTALFHDLAKGLEGDHSTLGAQKVDEYFAKWKFSSALTAEVKWLVESHLLLSHAAFRQNSRAPSTWARLFKRGVEGHRLNLLALFTAIDICATNPEAWSEWKAELLWSLVQNLNSEHAQGFSKLQKALARKGFTHPQLNLWVESLDATMFASLPTKTFVEDLIAASHGHDLPPKVLSIKGNLWIRFHRTTDDLGLFFRFAEQLFSLGLNVRSAFISTLPGLGVYDWMVVKTEKSSRQVEQWLLANKMTNSNIPNVKFQSVQLMSADDKEWIFSFKAKDQRGLLLAAAHSLVKSNLSVRWAQVHTWGNQVEDLFAVQPSTKFASAELGLQAVKDTLLLGSSAV